ncbi:SemiSWEET family transporter [Micromonospora sp. KC213]|uniref:SemiSWEET family sugar transporter n=1 Tax=Micromonospora sp. KC213 TaxID=2530378 RepID=UPI001047A1A9|nr:SemiSWEET family transporter [Micromonospora sp. KC213]TDC41902.1 hypothetical protein E1166_09850 [Micromonospora sp. KC213]
MTTALGLLAGILTTGCWLPQLLRSWRTKSTKDISWTYLAVLGTGVGLWTLYGAIIADPAVVLTNAATAVALLALAALKSIFERYPSNSGSADA